MVEEEGELLLTFIHCSGEKAHFYTLVGRKNLDKAKGEGDSYHLANLLLLTHSMFIMKHQISKRKHSWKMVENTVDIYGQGKGSWQWTKRRRLLSPCYNHLVFTRSIGQAKLPSSPSSDLNSKLPFISLVPDMTFSILPSENGTGAERTCYVWSYAWRVLSGVELISVNT